MDITDLRSLATVLCFIALAGVFYWTYHPGRKQSYDEAAMLPFAEEDELSTPSSQQQQQQQQQDNKVEE